MAENPLVRVAAATPVLASANALRRRIEGRIRSFDLLKWPSVPYGPDPAQRLYFWQPNDLGPRDGWPAVLLVHGGGWVEGGWESFESLGPTLANRGLMAVAMDYRLAPAHRWPAQLEDMHLALDALRGQQIDADRLALWGHSAGGHMALMAALWWPDWVRAVVAMGAPTDLRRFAEEGPDRLDLVFDDRDLDAASPLRVETARLPRTLLVHGALDRVVPIQQARDFAARHPADVELWEVADGDHGLHWPPVRAPWTRRRAIDWLVASLRPASRGSKWKIRRKKKTKA